MEEKEFLKQVGKNNPFQVPEGYFEHFTTDLMAKLPQREQEIQPTVTLWDRWKPYAYLAAFFAGAALIIKVGSIQVKSNPDYIASDIEQQDMQYINATIDNALLDDYSFYMYLSDAE